MPIATWNGYSFIGYDPACVIETSGHTTRIIEGSRITVRHGDPFDILKEL